MAEVNCCQIAVVSCFPSAIATINVANANVDNAFTREVSDSRWTKDLFLSAA